MPETEGNTAKTLIQFWKGYNIYDSVQNLAGAWGDVTKECPNGIWKKTLQRFVHECKGLARGKRWQKSTRLC